MARTNAEKKKAKRKIKQKERRQKHSRANEREKADFLFYEALWCRDKGNLDKALFNFEKALRLDPKNEEILSEMSRLGYQMKRKDVMLKALLALYDNDWIDAEQMPALCQLLRENGQYKEALSVIQKAITLVPTMKVRNIRSLKASLNYEQRYCQSRLDEMKNSAAGNRGGDTSNQLGESAKAEKAKKGSQATIKPLETASSDEHKKVVIRSPLPEIPIYVDVDSRAFKRSLIDGHFTSVENYELSVEAHLIRFKETFENLISLNSLKNIHSFWYQEETARKVLKDFRGRALLADEVGLGKTIEALMALKEYVQRDMVKSALILTPTPLVSQWKEELKVKFGLDFPSTNDPYYRTMGPSFWKEPFILASINIAKSKRNFSVVTENEYDMVIVDEAHHLKNRNTLNWKLVNALKKRFLLLLTATPVENNLIELYNLVTLLKPGQLKTAATFREKFMTRGDPTDPQNRELLKELLDQVMIRNTRALANIDIPPRFAQTIKVEPHRMELDLYGRISSLVRDINSNNGTGHKLLLKNLLEEAGSSSRAVGLTLSRMLQKPDLLLKNQREIQAINNMCQSLNGSSKNKILLELIKACRDKKIIFVKYLGTLEHVSEFLTWHGISHALFHGQMDNRKKEAQVENFRKDIDILLTTEIGGEGRNLQFCHQMINYDLPWNPMKIEQRIGRIHRIGQTTEVMIYNLCAAGSVEDYILQILDKKINMFELVIGEIDMILGRVKGEQEFSEMVYDIWINALSENDRELGFGQLGSKVKRAKTSYQKTKDLDEKLFGEDYEL
jgi:SNF2 family DNA or RNA helicase